MTKTETGVTCLQVKALCVWLATARSWERQEPSEGAGPAHTSVSDVHPLKSRGKVSGSGHLVVRSSWSSSRKLIQYILPDVTSSIGSGNYGKTTDKEPSFTVD